MCGIVGVVGSKTPVEIILDGLKKLEYRGYDSSGMALIEKGNFKIIKEEGKIFRLESSVKKKSLKSQIGIGHTRWATHGRPNKENAHPHASSQVCVVHNGIIENYQKIKESLQKSGAKFLSETDSEIIPHLIEHYLKKTGDIKKSIIAATKDLHGMFALAVLIKGEEDLIVVAKKGSPLVIGVGENENYISSDYYALSNQTNKIIALDDNEFAFVRSKGIQIFGFDGKEIKKNFKIMEADKSKVSKGDFKHFMLKEIHEQPKVLEDTLQTYVDLNNHSIHLPNFPFDLSKINKITIVACGTSYYAGLCAKYIIEEIAKIEVEVDIASEFRYRSHPFKDDNLMIFISQSGETADTIAALKYSKENNQKILSIVNVALSSMAQLSDAVILTMAGIEIGVASTKAYTAQIAALSLLAIHLADIRKKIAKNEKIKLLQDLAKSAAKIASLLQQEQVRNIKKIAKSLTKTESILFTGRSISQITAFESALKLKELSYINAQAIAAGELKHGTIALIDKNMRVIVIATQNKTNNLFDKTISNAEEIKARGGKIIFISDKDGIAQSKKVSKESIEIPEISGVIQEALVPVISTQLLAYYVALYKGNDVDQPRNLAKSVTVE